MPDLSSYTAPQTGSATVTSTGETFALPEWASYLDVYLDDSANGTSALNGGSDVPLPITSWVRVFERPVRLRVDATHTVVIKSASASATCYYSVG